MGLMDWMERRNLEAEYESAMQNRRLCEEDSHNPNWEISHQAMMASMLWYCYAQYILERLEEDE